MKKLIFFALFFCFSFIPSQMTVTILDAENQKPIPYAKINFKEKEYYKNTEENGKIILENDEQISEIQSFGYENLTIGKQQETYLLQPKTTDIEEIKISKPKFQKSFTLGSIKKNSMGFFASTKSWQVVDLFKNDISDEKIYIKKIRLPTEVNKAVKEGVFNLIFYENENGTPSIEKMKNIIVSCKSGKNITEIDLSRNPITLPKEGLFIGFEWILNEQNKYTYTTTVVHPDGTKEKNVLRHGIAPYFKGHETSDSNIFSFNNSHWYNILNNKKVNNSNYSLSIELELTN